MKYEVKFHSMMGEFKHEVKADKVNIEEGGELVFKDSNNTILTIFARGFWTSVTFLKH